MLIVYLVWGSTYYVMRVAFAELPQLMGSGLRFVLAGGTLMLVLRLRGAAMPTAKQWLRVLPIGTLMFLCGNGVVAIVGRYIASGVVAVLAATMPLCAALLGIFFGDRPTRKEWIALAVGFAGVAILSSGGDLAVGPPGMAVLVFFAPFGWALGSTLARKWAVPSGFMSPASQMVAGGVVMLLVGALRGETVPQAVSTTALVAFAYLVLIGSLVTFTAYSFLLTAVRPTLAMSYAYVNPVIAVAIGTLVGKEPLRAELLVSGALIVTAVALSVRK